MKQNAFLKRQNIGNETFYKMVISDFGKFATLLPKIQKTDFLGKFCTKSKISKIFKKPENM